MKPRLKLILLALTIMLSLVALWQVHRVAEQVRLSEEAKVRLWASAIGQRNQLAEATQRFFHEATLDEHREMELYTDILQSFADPDLGTDMGFSLRYVNYIVDSSHTPIIITSAQDSIITVPQELAGLKLEGDLMEEYSQNPPFDYNLWGMRMTLYYKESEYYTQLREVLEGFTQSFLTDITQNSVMVPVIIVDSTRSHIIATSSELDHRRLYNGDLSELIERFGNGPIEIRLPSGGLSYVYYETTPLLRALRWVPLLYLFIGVVIVIVTYTLFRTARRAEQNRIWVGLAKETAHQLGTPISSLMAWTQYLEGKTLDANYSAEINKDLKRLETVTHRFSKIGSIPELKEENVCTAIQNAINYLQTRASRKVKFVTNFPDEELVVPLNSYLFE
jgi:signal transduction histidine kinase